MDAMPHNMAELVHALDLGSNPREGVQVRVLRLIGGRRASLHLPHALVLDRRQQVRERG